MIKEPTYAIADANTPKIKRNATYWPNANADTSTGGDYYGVHGGSQWPVDIPRRGSQIVSVGHTNQRLHNKENSVDRNHPTV
jgi:hypothetical protein